MTVPEIIKAVGEMQPVEAEWLRIEEAESYARVGKTALYEMINNGLIKSMELKVKKSNTRGTRLIHLPSLRRYMQDEMARETERVQAKMMAKRKQLEGSEEDAS